MIVRTENRRFNHVQSCSIMFNRLNRFIVVVFLVSVVLTACASTPKTTSTIAPANEGGEGGVEASLVTVSDAVKGFAIGNPGTWSQDTAFTGGVKFVGGDDWMTLEFVILIPRRVQAEVKNLTSAVCQHAASVQRRMNAT